MPRKKAMQVYGLHCAASIMLLKPADWIESTPYSTTPFSASHFNQVNNLAIVFVHYQVWEFPLLPTSGRLTTPTIPPVAFTAAAYSRPIDHRCRAVCTRHKQC